MPQRSAQTRIFLIDDDPDILSMLEHFFGQQGYSVQSFGSANQAYPVLRKAPPSLVICDLNLPDLNGIEFAQKIHAVTPDIPVILITADTTTETAIAALHQGIFDYIVKPISLTEIGILAARAIRIQQLERISATLERNQAGSLAGLLGKSAKLKQVRNLIERVARTDSSVLITGESGTGKEVVARAIHAESRRARQKFVAVNCSAIPEHLLESELFGHKKGAFTGAYESSHGLFREANGGTLFLDEIGDMPAPLQAKLLRVIQDRKIRPVGDTKFHAVDIRIISATNQVLKEKIKDRSFREDLYYRLCVVPIELPPLRERREDIPVLAMHFAAQSCAMNGVAPKTFSPEALSKLLRLRWSGNVRQLENTVERAVILSEGDRIEETHIQAEEDVDPASAIASLFSGLASLEQLEREYISYVLSETAGNRLKTANILGIDRKTLYRKLRMISN